MKNTALPYYNIRTVFVKSYCFYTLVKLSKCSVQNNKNLKDYNLDKTFLAILTLKYVFLLKFYKFKFSFPGK